MKKILAYLIVIFFIIGFPVSSGFTKQEDLRNPRTKVKYQPDQWKDLEINLEVYIRGKKNRKVLVGSSLTERRGKRVYYQLWVKNYGKVNSIPISIKLNTETHHRRKGTWQTIDVGTLAPGKSWIYTFRKRFWRSGPKSFQALLQDKYGTYLGAYDPKPKKCEVWKHYKFKAK